MTAVKFGTDGWRAIIGADYTYANVERCAAAVARYLLANGTHNRVVVGYDTRFASDRFAQTAADVFCAHGIDVLLFDRPAPTPACSFAVQRTQSAAGVMITASHNPPEWNGFKVKSAKGGTAPTTTIEQIEKELANETQKTATKAGKVAKFDPLADYTAHLRQLVDLSAIKAANLEVIIDAMHGAGAGILKDILAGERVRELRSEPNPKFPDMKQPEPIAENLAPLLEAVRQSNGKAVGIAFDGDADRLGVVDERGEFMNTGDVFAVLFYQMLARRGELGAVACTITMSSMIDKIAKLHNVAVHRTHVGFKYVAPVMLAEKCVIAGEESGGYAFQKHLPDRDGIASALVFLEALAQSGKKPTELIGELHSLVGKHSYYREDLLVTDAQKAQATAILGDLNPSTMAGLPVNSITRAGGLKINLTDDGWWVACRLSGTEPLIRIYAEAATEQTARELVTTLKSALKIGAD